MTYSDVASALNEGKKIRMVSWKNAYWYKREDGTIMNHFEDTSPEQDVPTAHLFPRDLLWVAKGDWEIVNNADDRTPAIDEIVPVPNFSFGVALDYLKAGKKVARKGWNGKGMFLVLCPGSKVPADHMRVKPVKKFYKKEGCSTVVIAPHIDLKAADGTYVTGWLASQTDMLADDWNIVE